MTRFRQDQLLTEAGATSSAPGVPRPAQGQSEQALKYVTMGNDHQGAAGMAAHQSFQSSLGPRYYLRERFAAGRASATSLVNPGPPTASIGLDLLEGLACPCAEINLIEGSIDLHRQAAGLCQRCRRLQRALLGAAVDRIDGARRQPGHEILGLLPAGMVQTDAVQPPGQPAP